MKSKAKYNYLINYERKTMIYKKVPRSFLPCFAPHDRVYEDNTWAVFFYKSVN